MPEWVLRREGVGLLLRDIECPPLNRAPLQVLPQPSLPSISGHGQTQRKEPHTIPRLRAWLTCGCARTGRNSRGVR